MSINNNTDSTNIRLNMEKTNSQFQQNLKTISNINDSKNIQEKKEFINPDGKIKFTFGVQNSYHFPQDIERVWMIVKNFDILSLFSNRDNYPIVYIKGQDTWKEGNEFKGNFFGIYPFVARVKKSLNLPEIKKINWIFNFREKDYAIVKLELFKVTEDNSTVIYKKIKYNKNEIFEEIEKNMKINENSTFEQIEILLENEPINLLEYESGIINGKMEDIWDIVTDYSKITAIAPNNNYIPNMNLKTMKVGDYISVYNSDRNKNLNFYMKFKDERPGWNKWLILLEVYDADISSKNLVSSVLLQLTKINNKECQLTLITKFHQPVKTEEFRDITNRKKYLLLSVKDYFDNFYSPNSSN